MTYDGSRDGDERDRTDESGSGRWVDSLDWTFGDGTTGTGRYNAYRYHTAGSYTVTLTATGGDGGTTTDRVVVDVA